MNEPLPAGLVERLAFDCSDAVIYADRDGKSGSGTGRRRGFSALARPRRWAEASI
jgi:hypothetical protein